MRAVVMKFGGSSVVDAAAIDRVIGIVEGERSRGRAPVVVVSALGGVTDTLLALAHAARGGHAGEVSDGVTAVLTRHLEQADRLGAAADPALAGALDGLIRELQSVLDTIQRQRASDPRALDAVAAAGELLSSRLIAAALAVRGLPAAWVDAREAIRTDDRYTCAAPLVDETNAAVQAAIGSHVAAGRVAVLGGFIGRAPDGSTTTLGRGGSDYSASLVGAALGASEIQIWTDVDGMLTADPRIVYDAEVVPHLSFAEASELAYFGAKVLHPATILPAIECDIPVRILNSRNAVAAGTLITASPPPNPRPLTGLAGKRGLTVIDITSGRMLMAYGFLRRVFEVFERFRTSVDVVTTSEVSVSVTVDDRRDLEAIVAALSEFASVSVDSGMALLCAVGDRLPGEPAIAARAVGVLEEVPLEMISQAASRRNITVVLREVDLARAMRRLHAEFFGDANQPG